MRALRLLALLCLSMIINNISAQENTKFLNVKSDLDRKIVTLEDAKINEAKSILIRILKDEPNSIETNYYLASVYLYQNNTEDAIKYFEQTIKLNGDKKVTLYTLISKQVLQELKTKEKDVIYIAELKKVPLGIISDIFEDNERSDFIANKREMYLKISSLKREIESMEYNVYLNRKSEDIDRFLSEYSKILSESISHLEKRCQKGDIVASYEIGDIAESYMGIANIFFYLKNDKKSAYEQIEKYEKFTEQFETKFESYKKIFSEVKIDLNRKAGDIRKEYQKYEGSGENGKKQIMDLRLMKIEVQSRNSGKLLGEK